MKPVRLLLKSGVAGLLSAFAATSIAYADGLQSQWKKRQPMPAGFTQVQWMASRRTEPTLDRQTATILRFVRRNVRLQERTWESGIRNDSFGIVEQTPPVTQRTSMLDGSKKLRMVRTGVSPLSRCNVLHTHERAVCLRDEAYRKTNRFEVTMR